MNQKFDTHRPLFWLGICLIAGIVREELILWPWTLTAGGALAGAVVASVLFKRYRRWALTVLFAAVFLTGGLWYRNVCTLPPDHIQIATAHGVGDVYTVRGVAASSLQDRPGGLMHRVSFLLEARAICRQEVCRPVAGKVMAVLFVPPDIRVGDEVLLRGKLHRPPEFSAGGRGSYREFLRLRGIELFLTVKKKDVPVVVRRGQAFTGMVLTQRVRAAFARVYERFLLPGEAGLMKAFMLGIRDGIPEHVNDYFKRTGTAHIVAISGSNITLLAFIFFLLLGILRIGRILRFWVTVFLVGGYTVMAGGDAPVTRAALMSAVFLLSFVIEREQDMLNTFGFAAGVMALADPRQVFDAGYQLSFACVLAIVLIAPVLLKPVAEAGSKTARPFLWMLGETVVVSLAAWAGSAGIMAYTFGNLTPIGLLANIPVVPLAGLVTALGCALVLAAYVCVPLAWLFAGTLKAALNLLVYLSWVFSLVPGGRWPLPEVNAAAVTLYYILFLSGLWGIRRMRMEH